MYLSFFVGLIFIISNASATDCLVAKDVESYKTKTIIVDDVVFHLHFPEDRPWFTKKVIDTLERDIPAANRYFDSKPQSDVHLVTEAASESNGLATVFPYNIITLYDFPPLGNNYLKGTDEWIRNLVLHEYIHIITMDMTNGWIKGLRSIFGSAVKTNGIIPRWLNEGVAVWFESKVPGQGRLNQRGVKYQVYKALSDKDFCQGIECLDTPMKYPYGHAPYWIGGEFVKYIEELNPGFLRCVFKEHSYNVPFFLNKMFEICIGMDVEKAYKTFKEFYISTNSYLNNYCPVDKKFCEQLKKNKIDETTIDFESGTCRQGDYLVYVRRDELGRNRFYAPYKVEMLNTKNAYRTTFQSNYPLQSLIDKDSKCILKQFVKSGCSSSNLFSELEVPSFKTKEIVHSNALGIELEDDNVYQVFYKDGEWNYFKGDKKVKSYQSEIRPEFRGEDFSNNIDKKKELSEGDIYKGSRYLKPEYFLFDYSNFANLSALNLNTALSDPLKTQNIGVSITDYISDKEGNLWGGALTYSYAVNDWRFSLNYFKSFYVNSFSDEVASSDSSGLGLLTHSQLNSWKLTTGYGLRLLNRDDFISKRDTRNIFLSQTFHKVNNEIFRKQKSLSANYRLSFNEAESSEKENFLGLEGGFEQSFFLGKESQYGYTFNYGKYFKDDLKSGYLAAGGVNSFLASGYAYPLYMISYADLIGNELTTSRFYYGSQLTNFYKGHGMFPVFIKNSGFELGAEYAKGKYILTVDKVYRDEYATGVYAKYYLNTKLVYIWDATISLAFSQRQYPSKVNRILFLFDAAAF